MIVRFDPAPPITCPYGEMVDTKDLKSSRPSGGEGSTPSTGTNNFFNRLNKHRTISKDGIGANLDIGH